MEVGRGSAWLDAQRQPEVWQPEVAIPCRPNGSHKGFWPPHVIENMIGSGIRPQLGWSIWSFRLQLTRLNSRGPLCGRGVPDLAIRAYRYCTGEWALWAILATGAPHFGEHISCLQSYKQ